MRNLLTFCLVIFSTVYMHAQTGATYRSLEDRLKEADPLSSQQKVSLFGDLRLYKEDSMLLVWRKQELEKLKNIEYAKHVYSQDLSNYIEVFPTDTAEILRRYVSQLRVAGELNSHQVELVLKRLAFFMKGKMPAEFSILRFLNTEFTDALSFNLPAEQYGMYLKNKIDKVRWSAERATERLYFYYRNQLHMSEQERSKELRKLVEASKPH